jgi:hypothetical protein
MKRSGQGQAYAAKELQLVVRDRKKNRKQTTLSISRETKGLLDAMKHPGQSYNGLIQEIIKSWKKEGEQKEKR